MTTIRKVLMEAQDTPTAQTTVYTAVNCKATIDAATATNTSGGTLTLSVNLVPPAGTASAANKLVSAVSIASGGSYALPEIRGHDLEAGGFISVIASGAGITLRVSGRETTTA